MGEILYKLLYILIETSLAIVILGSFLLPILGILWFANLILKRKIPRWTRYFAYIFLIYIISVCILIYTFYKESYEHDRLPVVLSPDVKMEKVSKEIYDSNEYSFGYNCITADEINALKILGEPIDDILLDDSFRYNRCQVYLINAGKVFWIDNIHINGKYIQYVFLERTSGKLEKIIRDTGEYAKFVDYPGISSFKMKGNGKTIVFIYWGWNNPKKFIRLNF